MIVILFSLFQKKKAKKQNENDNNVTLEWSNVILFMEKGLSGLDSQCVTMFSIICGQYFCEKRKFEPSVKILDSPSCCFRLIFVEISDSLSYCCFCARSLIKLGQIVSTEKKSSHGEFITCSVTCLV